MVLMSMLEDGRFIIEDVVRGQWSALEREETLLRVAQADRDAHPRHYEVVVEQEPGSGGKESAEASIRMLRGFRCFADKVTGSKELRAEPFAAQVQGSNVWLVAGRWVEAYIDEAEAWPNGKYRDQIDASSGAFNRMTSKPVFNLDAMAS
jgi:predicted phage terminase large subunit-like protein